MIVVTSLAELQEARAQFPSPFGLVPTMGYLHEGHLSLARRARDECASVGASIFVNPTQFGDGEDLENYPRDLDRDLALFEGVGVDLVWKPSNDEMYPSDFQTWVIVEDLTQPLEGKYRPGHFRGVTTVVTKLFAAMQPDRAYFGQKDAQQAIVLQRMTADLSFPIEVIVCPTVREVDGLAMSSRNSYLTAEKRAAAVVLYRSLSAAADEFAAGERDADALRSRMRAVLDTEPLAEVEYISVADPNTLVELSGPVERALLSMAVYIGKTRLIDNILVGV
jgi:pantoate--beta-alanine ligase